MASHKYSRLSVEEPEDKPLVGNRYNNQVYGDVIHIVSKRWTAILYLLCALTVSLAVANFATALSDTKSIDAHVRVDDLPRPDVFAGLPGTHTIINANKHDHNHTQDNAHGHTH